MNGNHKAIGSAQADSLLATIADTRLEFIGKRRERVLATVAAAREAGTDKEMVERLLRGETRPFSRRIRKQFAANGAPSTFVDFSTPANKIRPYPFDGTTQETKQPEDDGILNINEVAFEFPATLLQNTLHVLREQFGLIITYPGGKKKRVLPLADVLEAGNVYTPPAGVDNATNPGEGVVAGTQTIARPAMGLLRFDPDEMLVVKPNESEIELEIKRLPQFSTNPTLTGETLDLYYGVTFRGERVSVNHEKF